MALHISKTEEEVLKDLADHIVGTAKKSIANHGKFSLALSGGSSPKKLYELLASPAFRDQVEWNKVYFFFGDERYVPQTDAQSNYLMSKTTLFDPLGIDASQVFAFDTSQSPDSSAKAYQESISNFFAGKQWCFDMVLLGLGDNSHTASLFPHTTVLRDKVPAAAAVFLEDQQVYRLTLNAPLINDAHHIAFLVYGEGKAIAVQHILEDEKDPGEYPAQLIAPKADWFLDEAAAKYLNSSLSEK